MKRLITVLLAVLLVVGYGYAQTGQTEQAEQTEQTTQAVQTTKSELKPSFIEYHCREHTLDYMEFTPEIYDECVELHTKGLVKADSPDEHLSVVHY
jgi:uncharacterized protein YpmS